ncbi:hypothetical protein [Flammeovirga sp. EKP202]|uniref:hypothetical protein n=1 Tax=Flammeovirga sp. EKP202 TaxID=2770592 RepID=UPI00165FDC24|nr:hypothetical protein [Flammeovirga sp. EKP202]MBD0401881.1 hypothetical protein [Flammeovirga sp. EKP202]
MQRLESSLNKMFNQKVLANLCPYHRQRISTSLESTKLEIRSLFMTFVDGELDRFKKQIGEESLEITRTVAEGYVNNIVDLLETRMASDGDHFTSEELINGALSVFNTEGCPVFHTKK